MIRKKANAQQIILERIKIRDLKQFGYLMRMEQERLPPEAI